MKKARIRLMAFDEILISLRTTKTSDDMKITISENSCSQMLQKCFLMMMGLYIGRLKARTYH